MDKKKYCYSMRISLDADQYSEQRIDDLVRYSVEYAFDDVMFFVNTGAGNRTHPTPEEVRPQVELIKRAKPRLNAAGISVSVNPLTSIGQGASQRTMRSMYDHHTLMRDIDGVTDGTTFCPLCKHTQKYLAEMFAFYTEETEPEIIWVEDDFRYHNRGRMNWGGCFCDLHMKRYCQQLGFEVTREEFVAEILKEGQGKSVYRDAYADVQRQSMIELAQTIGDAVRKVNDGKTLVGLMSSHPEEHAAEYRDWSGILYALSDTPIDRLHIPQYEQVSPMCYGWWFNKVVPHARARVPKETWILPELENYPSGPFSKSARFTAFVVESTLPVIPHGCTLAMYGGSNGIIPQWRVGQACKELKPYMQAFMDLGIDFEDMDGVYIPFCDESVKTMHPTDYFTALDHLKPDDAFFSAYLSSLGIAYKFVGNFDAVKGKIIAISGQWLRNFDEAYIRRLFRDNVIILNADSLKVLLDMGLGELAGVDGYLYDEISDHDVRYEMSESPVFGIDGYRKNARGAMQVRYTDDVIVYSRYYNSLHEVKGPAVAQYGNVLIWPHVGEYRDYARMDPLYQHIFGQFFDGLEGMSTPVRVEEYCVSPYYYAKAKTLILINFTDDDWDTLHLTLPQDLQFSKIRYLQRDGQWANCPFIRNANQVQLQTHLAGIQTLVLQFEE